MGISLIFRYRTRYKMEMQLPPNELARRFCYRPKARVERHYRVGDIRKAKHHGCSLSAKIRITKIEYSKKARKTIIRFKRIREHHIIHYINIAEELDFDEKIQRV